MSDEAVLKALKNSAPHPISGEDISRILGVSRSAVWKQIRELRRLGYVIEAQPHLGYRYLAAPDKLFADEISYRLGTRWVGRQILSYESLNSTNDAALRLGEGGAKEGVCVFAERQTKGRGRLGRRWQSPAGKGLLFSVLLRPALAPGAVSKITLVAAVSVIKALRPLCSRELGIKWPNDLYIGKEKLGGILTELSAEADRVNFVVVGIGLNINAEKRQLPPQACSLRSVTGRKHSRVAVAQSILRHLEEDCRELRQNHFDALARQWEEFSLTTGQRVSAKLIDRELEGEALGIDADGALWIRRDDGLQEKVVAGDIRHLRA